MGRDTSIGRGPERGIHLALLLLLPLLFSPVGATTVRDDMEVVFPPGLPISPIAWVLESGRYHVQIHRTVVVDWSPDDTRQSITLTFTDIPPPSGLPYGSEVTAPRDVEWTYSYGPGRVICKINRTVQPTEIRFQYLLDSYRYVAIFGSCLS